MSHSADAMTSSKPYLIRAIHEWILDNGMTPHLVVDADFPDTLVPREFVENGRIVLNIAPGAVRELLIGNDWIQFNARFSGVARDVMVPSESVIGIFTRENGQGMVFPEPQYPEPKAEGAEPVAGLKPVPMDETGSKTGDKPDSGRTPRKGKGGPTLKVVK